jgi:ribose 5-phosphate isomerase B
MASNVFSYNTLIYVASDHNGNAARAHVLRHLRSKGHNHFLVDLGPTEDEGKVDYPDKASEMCRKMRDVLKNWKPDKVRGILICGTGTGMLIAANRFPWIRAGLATDRVTAYLMREHNDANVLVLGQWRTPLGQMDEMVEAFLGTPFGGGRHVARLEKLEQIP